MSSSLPKGFSRTAWALPLILPACVGLVWFVLTHTEAVPEYLLPSPGSTVHMLAQYLGLAESVDTYGGRFFGDLKASLLRVLCGCVLSIPAGLVLGMISGRSRWFASLLAPTVHGLRAVPGISWLPLVLLWMGVGFKAAIVLIFLAAFFPSYLSAATASATVPVVLLRAGQMLGLRGIRLFWHVILPACMPGILGGLRLAVGMAFSYLVLGELTGVPDGLGAMIMDARMVGRVDCILCGIVLIALIGWLCDFLIVAVVRLISKGARVL